MDDYSVGNIGRHRFSLTRSSLRDLVIICSLASSILWHAGTMMRVTGFMLLAAGCFIHALTKGVLIRNEILCRRGIYAMVRHPYYLANYLIDTSLCLLSGNPYLLVAYPFLFFWSYGPTLRKEERFLASRYGDSFLDESFRIPQLFPETVSLRNWRRLLEGFSVKRITFTECSRIARFWFLASLVLLVQALKLHGFTVPRLVLSPPAIDYDAFSFMLLTAVFFSLNLVFLIKARGRKAQGMDLPF